MGQEHLARIVIRFIPEAEVLSIDILGKGNINDTYLVNLKNHRPLVLQRINPAVFPEPEVVVDNSLKVTRFIANNRPENQAGLQEIMIYPERSGRSYHRDQHGQVWRLSNYIEDSVDGASIHPDTRAFEGGRALGLFHQQVSGMDSSQLGVPLPGFHHLPGYRDAFLEALSATEASEDSALAYCLEQARVRQDDAEILTRARAENLLQPGVIHGDPKLDNVLFEGRSGKALAVIDLDTVSEGLRLYDLGDCLRSFCNHAGEKPPDAEMVHFDAPTCKRVLQGYHASGTRLEDAEVALLFQSIRLMTYELGLRFVTDFLVGNRYFKVDGERDNLDKARVQFQLLSSIECQQEEIERIIATQFRSSKG